MAKSWLLGRKAEITDATFEGAHTGTIVRTYVSGYGLKIVIQMDDSGRLEEACPASVRMIDAPSAQ